MKCLVLAGGSGDRLWPLSRKSFPKQFMEIRKGRSMFQETILRNIPFCDEFVIFTNHRYENIIRSQMLSFQDLRYRIIVEDKPLKTAPPIIFYAMSCAPSDELLIASTDHVIDGNYNSCISKVKSIISNGYIAAVAVRAEDRGDGYHYIRSLDDGIQYSSTYTPESYFDCGILAARSGVLLKYADNSFKQKCVGAKLNGEVFYASAQLAPTSLSEVINTSGIRLVEAQFSWQRITSISSYCDAVQKDEKQNIVVNDSQNVRIVNNCENKLVVVNGLNNIVVANTNDAVYITSASQEGKIKDIARNHNASLDRYFTERPISYFRGGMIEKLDYCDEYSVSRLVIYPNCRYETAAKNGVAISYTVLAGQVQFVSESSKEIITANQTFCVRQGKYLISNESRKTATLICTTNNIAQLPQKEEELATCVYKMTPSLHYALWGGSKLHNVLNKDTHSMPVVAESWELSAHPAGPSCVAEGEYAGLSFVQLLNILPAEQIGWKVQAYPRFPVLIKFIDAAKNLSVQVHPGDDYAFPHENDYGKNEMWYIMDAEDSAFIYDGFIRDTSPEEVRNRIENNTIESILNKIPVKKGQTYFLKAGTVHAIGGGCLICEIQQSSNVTYRLYDYGRLDKDGKPRQLHIDKALDVINFSRTVAQPGVGAVERGEGFTKQIIGSCKYFKVEKYSVDGEMVLPANMQSFRALVITDGQGELAAGDESHKTARGDTWFVGARSIVYIKGKLELLNITI